MSPAMTHPADPLIGLPHEERIRSRKLTEGVATIIADATGLSQACSECFTHPDPAEFEECAGF